jgi:hypothetical protein
MGRRGNVGVVERLLAVALGAQVCVVAHPSNPPREILPDGRVARDRGAFSGFAVLGH